MKALTPKSYRRNAWINVGLCVVWVVVGVARLASHGGWAWELGMAVAQGSLALASFSNASRREQGVPVYGLRSAWREARRLQSAHRPDALRYLAFEALTAFAVAIVIAHLTFDGA